VSELLTRPPYGPRDDAQLLREMNALTAHHRAGCDEYARIWPAAKDAETPEDVPYLHVGLFKQIELKTRADESHAIKHERALLSSATTSGVSSRIVLDSHSGKLQGQSSAAILADFVGPGKRPLFVLDSARSMMRSRDVSARLMAAMSLQPLSTDLHFLLDSIEQPGSAKWDVLAGVLEAHDEILVYGFTYLLWQVFGQEQMPDHARKAMHGKRVHFIHSGGWKKLEAQKVDRETFDATLLRGLDPASRVVDYYGLVEQVGVIYPLCEAGYRHVPAWADVVVRHTATLRPLIGEPGQLQLMNVLAWGAPYHSVLTEDVGQIVPGACPCGRQGPRFELLGRLPKAELRGCANV
jgi:hypothetical protein